MNVQVGRIASSGDRVGGPADLSRYASQPKALADLRAVPRPDFFGAQLKASRRYVREGRKTRWLDCIRRLENARLRFDDRRPS